MSENKHTMSDLYSMQAAPLSVKIKMTARRIRDWVDEYGQDGVYVSFSGGKDSTVLVDIVRNVCGYKNIPLVFIDVPTQYPELKQFAMTFENLVIWKNLNLTDHIYIQQGAQGQGAYCVGLDVILKKMDKADLSC